MSISQFVRDGLIDPGRIATVVNSDAADVAFTAGLEYFEIQGSNLSSQKSQNHLRQLVEILSRTERRFGHPQLAYAWIRSEPLYGLNGLTAMNHIQVGRGSHVLAYIDDYEGRACA